MKWLVLTCFLLWARHGEGGALKCLPEDSECISQIAEEVEQKEIDIRRPSGSTDAPAECLTDTEWDSHCHRCRCVDGEAQCDRRLECESIEDPIRCKPNTTFERECNSCLCLESGLGLCTVEECRSIPTKAPAPSEPKIPRGVDCAPGTTWQSQCNDCVCSPEGYRHCTERTCASQETERPQLCAPQSEWLKDCNMCWCNSGHAVCTKMGCVGLPSYMHFEGQKETREKQKSPVPINFPEVANMNSNDLLESDTNDEKHKNEHLEDFDEITDPMQESLTGVHLKDLEDFDNNDVDTPIQIPDQVVTDFAENDNPKVLDKDSELLELLLRHGQDQTTERQIPDDKKAVKDVEVLDDSYFNQNGQNDGHSIKKRSVCKANEEFQNECNTCKCSESGQSYTCTQNECMDREKEEVDKEVEVFMESEGGDHIERHSVCKPNTVFYQECKPCHCNSDGTSFSCATKDCPVPEEVEVFHEPHVLKSAKNSTKKVCVENRMFILNCNTCWCNEDGTSYFCTRKVCAPGTEEPVIEEGSEKLRVIKKECRPGEVFEVDCNMCRCNPDGKSYSCTRRACFDEEAKNQTVSRKTRATPQEPPKNCQPGQKFRMDCNQCLCDNEGQNFSCTRIDCAALNNHNGNRRRRDVSQKVVSDCVPGSVFDQDCNVCRCTEDGGHASCTLKRCPSKENATLTATESSFRCNPGEQFKQSCNDCSCSADGKSVFCTLLICDDKLSPEGRN